MEGQPDNQTYLQSLLSLLTAQQTAAQQPKSANHMPANQMPPTPPNVSHNLTNILQAAYYPQMGQSSALSGPNPAAMPFQASLTPDASTAQQQLPQQSAQPQLANGFPTDFGLDAMGGGRSSPLALTSLQNISAMQGKGVGDSKEKNRQAQRRFRERQKQMISHLQEQVKVLSQKVDQLTKQNEELAKENRALKQQNGVKTSKGPGTKAARKTPSSPIVDTDTLGQSSVHRPSDHETVHQSLINLGDIGALPKGEI